jgi:hypothetical protein
MAVGKHQKVMFCPKRHKTFSQKEADEVSISSDDDDDDDDVHQLERSTLGTDTKLTLANLRMATCLGSNKNKHLLDCSLRLIELDLLQQNSKVSHSK